MSRVYRAFLASMTPSESVAWRKRFDADFQVTLDKYGRTTAQSLIVRERQYAEIERLGSEHFLESVIERLTAAVRAEL